MVLITSLGNANEWIEIELFCNLHKKLIEKYFKLENGIPSHDTFQREWNEHISRNDGEGIKKILNIDGKTMKGSKTENKKPLHVVFAWCD